MSVRPALHFAETPQEVADSVRRFSEGAAEYPDRARRLLAQSSYWVFFPAARQFGPSKFSAFRGMDFEIYEQLLNLDEKPRDFTGRKARRCIEKLLEATFAPQVRMTLELMDWGRELMSEPDVFDNVDHSRWQFVRLPADCCL